ASVVGVFVVRDVLTPGRVIARVVDVEQREMAHEAVWRRTVPVLLARLEEDAVACLEYLDRPAAPLRTADALEDVDRLAIWMGVPGGARTGHEVHADRACARGARRCGDRVEVHRAGEPLGRPVAGLERVPGDLHQPTAFFTSEVIVFSSAGVSFVKANSVGHIDPASRFALSLKPRFEYRDLNLPAFLKKTTTLPSFAYAGIPYHVFGVSSGAAARTSSSIRFASARSDGAIAAIAARTAESPSSFSFSSFARARIAAFSSAVNPFFSAISHLRQPC